MTKRLKDMEDIKIYDTELNTRYQKNSSRDASTNGNSTGIYVLNAKETVEEINLTFIIVLVNIASGLIFF